MRRWRRQEVVHVCVYVGGGGRGAAGGGGRGEKGDAKQRERGVWGWWWVGGGEAGSNNFSVRTASQYSSF